MVAVRGGVQSLDLMPPLTLALDSFNASLARASVVRDNRLEAKLREPKAHYDCVGLAGEDERLVTLAQETESAHLEPVRAARKGVEDETARLVRELAARR